MTSLNNSEAILTKSNKQIAIESELDMPILVVKYDAKQQLKSIVLAVGGSILFALANALTALYATEYGLRGVTCNWFGSLLMFVSFHMVNSCLNCKIQEQKGFDMYYNHTGDKSKLSKTKLFLVFMRSLLMICLHVSAMLCFQFFEESGSQLNSGIITCLFTSSIIWSTILFYFIYKQKIGLTQLVGMSLILGSVTMVSIGGYNQVSHQKKQDQNVKFFYFSIIFGFIQSFVLTSNLLMTKLLITQYKMTPYQLTYDSMFYVFIIYLPIFVWDFFYNEFRYPVQDFLLLASSQVCGSTGMVLINTAVKYGKGGIVQSIENLKMPWQTLIMLLLSGGKQVPTLVQIFGMICGVFGAIVIVWKQNKGNK